MTEIALGLLYTYRAEVPNAHNCFRWAASDIFGMLCGEMYAGFWERVIRYSLGYPRSNHDKHLSAWISAFLAI